MKYLMSIFLFLAASVAQAQMVTMPSEYTADPGEWMIVSPTKVDGDSLQWRWDAGLSEVVLPPSWKVDTTQAKVFKARKAGKYKIEVWTAKVIGGKAVPSPIASTWLIVGDPVPVDPPGPGPTPVPPTPVVTGLRVLIVEESGKRHTLPESQVAILFSATVQEYLDKKCVASPPGKLTQGGKEWGIFDQDTSMRALSPFFQSAMERAKKGGELPRIVINDYEGPLPATVVETMTLLKKYGGE